MAVLSHQLPKCPESTKGKWPDCQKIVRSCPEGTTGKSPNAKQSRLRAAPKGLIGKWPKCREPDKPDLAVKPCPDGHVRKGKKCVELTKNDGGKTPPAVVKTETRTSPAGDRGVDRQRTAPAAGNSGAGRCRPGQRDRRAAGQPIQCQCRSAAAVMPLLDGALVRLRLRPTARSSRCSQRSAPIPTSSWRSPITTTGQQRDTSPKTVPQYADETIGSTRRIAWRAATGVMIAVIDTAIEGAHPELTGAIAGMFDAVGEGPSTAEPHGTRSPASWWLMPS